MKRLVVGDGPVARALAEGLDGAERWWRGRGDDPPRADVIVLAVRDDAIADAAARVMASQVSPPVLIHCAGALPAHEPFAALATRPRGVALLHPLTSLAGAPGDTLAGVVLAIAGDDVGRVAALALAAELGGLPLELPAGAETLARYHAAAALVANHSVALVDAGVELLAGLGLPRERATSALAALLASTARNLGALGLPAALTGPISRGDAGVVARHLAALASRPELDALYRATAQRVTRVAEDQGRADPAALARIRALLATVGDGD